MRSLILAVSIGLSLTPPPPAAAASVACVAVAESTTLPAVVPIDVSNNHVYVKVCVAGRELDFILDTGAGLTSIDLGLARQLGITLGSPLNVRGAGAGSVSGAQVRNAALTIGGSSIEQPIAIAIDLSRLPLREGHRMDGILAYDFIVRNVVAIDYARKELRLYDRGRFRYDGPGVSVPIEIIGQHPHINASVKLADGETVRGRFIVDVGSGAALTLVKGFVEDHHLRDRVGPTLKRFGSGGIGGQTASEFGRISALDIGGLQLANMTVQLFGDSAGVFTQNPSWVGNIGGSILRRFTLFLDYGAKRMILEPNAAFGEVFDAEMVGASYQWDDSLTTVRVDAVFPGSPAAEAGLLHDDVIVAIDGQPMTPRAFTELRDGRFRRAGERLVFTVRRGGEVRRVEIVTRRMV